MGLDGLAREEGAGVLRGGRGDSAAELHPELPCGQHGVAVQRHPLEPLNRFLEGNRSNRLTLKGHHRAELTRRDAPHGGGAEAESEVSVVSDGRAAALNVAEGRITASAFAGSGW